MKQSLGEWGEDYAASYFENRDWTVLTRNYATPYGECDLIVEKDSLTVFVEVKTRQTREFGPPEAAITSEKREHLRRIARHYLGEQEQQCQVRFDVLAIEFDPQDPDVRHLQGAFGANQ